MFKLFSLLLCVVFVSGCSQSTGKKNESPPSFPARSAYDGWISGGGAGVGDSSNPWFLANSSELSFCIEASETFKGYELEKMVRRALEFWDFEIAQAFTPGYFISKDLVRSDEKIELENGAVYYKVVHTPATGAHNFRSVSCSEDPDVRFQFGVLSEKQRGYLKKPASYIGVAVRTDYDRITMKGKGFVYISPDGGVDGYEGTNLMPNAWKESKGTKLELVLKHEVGHIFGLPHTPRNHLMAEDFPERLVMAQVSQDETYEVFGVRHSVRRPQHSRGFFSIDRELFRQVVNLPHERDHRTHGKEISVETANLIREFFALKAESTKVEFLFENGHLYVSQWVGEVRSYAGKAEFKELGITEVEPLSSVWIPEESQVLPKPEYSRRVRGAGFYEKTMSGTFRGAEGEFQRPITIQVTNGRYPNSAIGDRVFKILGSLSDTVFVDILK